MFALFIFFMDLIGGLMFDLFEYEFFLRRPPIQPNHNQHLLISLLPNILLLKTIHINLIIYINNLYIYSYSGLCINVYIYIYIYIYIHIYSYNTEFLYCSFILILIILFIICLKGVRLSRCLLRGLKRKIRAS